MTPRFQRLNTSVSLGRAARCSDKDTDRDFGWILVTGDSERALDPAATTDKGAEIGEHHCAGSHRRRPTRSGRPVAPVTVLEYARLRVPVLLPGRVPGTCTGCSTCTRARSCLHSGTSRSSSCTRTPSRPPRRPRPPARPGQVLGDVQAPACGPRPASTSNALVSHARDLGLDTERFRREVTGRAYAAKIEADVSEGVRNGGQREPRSSTSTASASTGSSRSRGSRTRSGRRSGPQTPTSP